MTAHAQNIVEFPTVEDKLSEIAADMAASKKALIKSGGKRNGGKIGTTGADVLPPDGSPPRYDDLANSKRFLDLIGDEMLYCVESKKWLIWQGSHWEIDRSDFVFDYAAEFAQGLYDDAMDTAGYKNAQRANNRSGFNAFLELAQRKVSASIETFDEQPRLLNCKNGTLDLQTGSLKPHDKADRITRRVACDYDADVESPTFTRFIERVLPDPSVRAFVQRSIGYSLLGNVRERSFWILYGTGNNGKSIFTNLFTNLLGEYASTTRSESIMQGKQNAIPNDIARLKGKRFVVVPETGENERMNEALVKALSAGDKVSARYLFGEFFDFFFSGKLWIATNHKPTITDHSKGFWDRIKLIPFTQDIPASEVIKSDDLMSSLMAEASGVLNWAVQGCRDYFDLDGLETPEIIQKEIDAYRREQDSIAQFIEERCQTIQQARDDVPQSMLDNTFINPINYRVSNKDLYAAYKEFCTANGEYLRSHRRLTQNMHERGFRQLNSGGRYWDGVKLVSTE